MDLVEKLKTFFLRNAFRTVYEEEYANKRIKCRWCHENSYSIDSINHRDGCPYGKLFEEINK